MAIKYTDYKNANFVTHGRTFHCDEVFCIPIFELLFKNIKLCRLGIEEEDVSKPLSGQIWFDIGGGELDHHQREGNGYHKRIIPNRKSIPYASFGLVWRKYGRDVCREFFCYRQSEPDFDDFVKYVFNFIELYLVRGIDASDNGIFPMKPDIAYKDIVKGMDIRSITISYIISTFNDYEEENKGLIQAINLARSIIMVFLEKAAYSFDNGIPVKEARFNIEDDFKNALYSICLDILVRNDIRLPETVFDNQAQREPLYKVWELIKHDYLINKFGNDWQLADKNITSLINGICAEIDGVTSTQRRHYDDVYFASLKDVFGNKSYYVGDYEGDLSVVVNMIFEKILTDTQIKISSEKFVKGAIVTQKGHILELPEKTYWKELVSNMPEADRFWFVVMPTQTGLWKVNPIRSRKTLNGYRKGFPKSWLGLRRKELADRKIYGVKFIHGSGIMALCDDKRSAIELCKKAFGNAQSIK